MIHLKTNLYFCNLILMFAFLTSDIYATVYSDVTPIVNYLKTGQDTSLPSNLANVDCIYIINLDKRLWKWERTCKELKQYAIQGNRFSAVDGIALSDQIQQELAGEYPVRLFRGALGCLLSHVSIYKDAYEKGYNVIWIMEDDVQILEDPSCISDYVSKLSKIDPRWDVFYTDWDTRNTDTYSEEFGQYVPAYSLDDADIRPDRNYLPKASYAYRMYVGEGIMKLGLRYGMYSYLLSRAGMKKLLDYFTHTYVWTHVDREIHVIDGIREYSTLDEIVTVDISTGISDTAYIYD